MTDQPAGVPIVLPAEVQARHLRLMAEGLMRRTTLDKSPAGLVKDLQHVIDWLTYYHDKAEELATQADV